MLTLLCPPISVLIYSRSGVQMFTPSLPNFQAYLWPPDISKPCLQHQHHAGQQRFCQLFLTFKEELMSMWLFAVIQQTIAFS